MSSTPIQRFWRATRITGLVVREIIGWVLLVAGLNTFRICFGYLNEALVIEGFVASIIGIMLFRGGLQLVKVAVAARSLRNEPSPSPPTRAAL